MDPDEVYVAAASHANWTATGTAPWDATEPLSEPTWENDDYALVEATAANLPVLATLQVPTQSFDWSRNLPPLFSQPYLPVSPPPPADVSMEDNESGCPLCPGL